MERYVSNMCLFSSYIFPMLVVWMQEFPTKKMRFSGKLVVLCWYVGSSYQRCPGYKLLSLVYEEGAVIFISELNTLR